MDTYVTGLESEGNNSIILKGRFKAVETNTYGLFIIFLNEEQRMVDNLMAIASHYSSLYDIDPSLPWSTIEENIINLKWKGDIAVNVSVDLQNYMESSLDRDRGSELFNLIKNNDQMKIESLLQAILIKPLADRNIVLETVSEKISKESMRIVRAERNRSKEKKTAAAVPKVRTDAGTVIDVDLILAPVSGIPIYELSKGDKIMIKINDKSTRGRYYIDLLGARVDGNIIPIPAEVTEIKRDENREYSILCKIDDHVFGRAIETEQVKLKRYDELFQSDSTKQEITLQDVSKPKKGFPIFVVITGALMFLVIMVFIFMWFYNLL